MNRFEIFAYIILLNLISMILLIYTSVHFIVVYFLLFIITGFPFGYKARIQGKKLSKIIKYHHYWIYEIYEIWDNSMRPFSQERFAYLRTVDLIKDKNAVAELNKEEKELLQVCSNSIYAGWFSFILINVNLIISSIYFT